MKHESDIEKMIDVVDTELGFAAIYNKEYMPKEYEEEIRSANILLTQTSHINFSYVP